MCNYWGWNDLCGVVGYVLYYGIGFLLWVVDGIIFY